MTNNSNTAKSMVKKDTSADQDAHRYNDSNSYRKNNSKDNTDVIKDIVIRPVQQGDIHKGLLETLDALKPASSMPIKKALEILDEITSDPNRLIAVAVSKTDGTIVGTATILFEKKLIHHGGIAGHIEDVAVISKLQNSGIGSAVVRYLISEAHKRGCYKTILGCTDNLVKYYTKLGFRRGANEMRYDHTIQA